MGPTERTRRLRQPEAWPVLLALDSTQGRLRQRQGCFHISASSEFPPVLTLVAQGNKGSSQALNRDFTGVIPGPAASEASVSNLLVT